MDKPEPDTDAGRRFLLRGGIHPQDVDSLVWLFTTFRHVPYLAEAIDRWQAADPKIVELARLGNEIRFERRSIVDPGSGDIAGWIERIDRIDGEIAPLTVAFAQALGRGSRAITWILTCVNLATGALLIGLAVWRTRKLVVQRRDVETALDAHRRKAETTLSSIGQAVITIDAEGRLDYLNPAGARLLRVSLADARHARLCALFELKRPDGGALVADLTKTLVAGEAVNLAAGSTRLVRRDGEQLPVSIVGAPILSGGRVGGAVIVISDMTREQDLIDGLSWQAMHDPLTGLYNRRGFEERLSQAVEGSDGALLLIDLDQFKIVNDTCGHAAGDELLRQIAGRFGSLIEPSDTLGRLGGDEFGILLCGRSGNEATAVAERARQAIESLSFAWEGRFFSVTASVGLVGFRAGGSDVEATMRAADIASYMAKERGGNRVLMHETDDTELQERVVQMAWVPRIRRALDEDRFVLFGQPIASLQDDGVTHVELLVRMRDEDGRLIGPASFIPPAERFGLMPAIDRWVVRTGFDAMARRLSATGRNAIGTCAINLSGATFSDPGFPAYVRDQFVRTGVAPETICFEITETSAISNIAAATDFIRALKTLGCRFSLDDFGSGMSSFAYLKTLPVDYLKIDGSFVKDMLVDRIDHAMVEMIHHIGQVTGKKTIAEFAETPEIVRALREIGVDFAQGYAIAAPAPFEDGDIDAWLAGVSAGEPLRKIA